MAAILKALTELPGDIKYHAANAIPAGWLKANGAVISRTAYAALFARIGTTFGAGDGSTTFALPDLRGEFVRGFDDGRGVDTGRVFGSAQTDAYKTHNHTVKQGGTSGSYVYGGGYIGAGTTTTENSVGAAETRPRNVAMLACIKY